MDYQSALIKEIKKSAKRVDSNTEIFGSLINSEYRESNLLYLISSYKELHKLSILISFFQKLMEIKVP